MMTTPDEKFARYRELCDMADEAMDSAISRQVPRAWIAAESRNADAANFWWTDLRGVATEEAIRYNNARRLETLAWMRP